MRNWQKNVGEGGFLIVLVVAALAGCDRENGRTRAGAGAQTASSRAAGTPIGTGTGVIRGTVKYAGAKPQLKPTQRDCHPGGPQVVIPDESIVINADGTLKNAVVFLKTPPVGGIPQKPPVVDQKNCVYVPHVVAVQTGQAVKFTSGDPVLHNVHVLPNPNGEYNQGISQGDSRSYPVDSPGFMKVTCDVHPWMVCRVAAFDHPFFDVTGTDGTFEFRNLPPGAYTVALWHEKLGQSSQDVVVTNDKPADVAFTMSPRK